MKDRPILFSAPMVRALLAGTKTQTRRVVKPQPDPNHPHDGGTKWVYDLHKNGLHVPVGSVGHLSIKEKTGLSCPYGQPGDRIWVREAWRAETEGAFYKYRADALPNDPLNKWTPSIHMPRAASRITLEIVSVRLERLQDISEADAKAEGCSPAPWSCAPGYEQYTRAHREGYRKLWGQINGDDSWGLNPWVWVVEFNLVKP